MTSYARETVRPVGRRHVDATGRGRSMVAASSLLVGRPAHPRDPVPLPPPDDPCTPGAGGNHLQRAGRVPRGRRHGDADDPRPAHPRMGPAGEELLRPDLGLRPADAAAAHPGHGCLPDQAGQHLVPSSGGSSLGFNSRPKRNESSHESGSPSRRDHCRRSYGMNRQVRTALGVRNKLVDLRRDLEKSYARPVEEPWPPHRQSWGPRGCRRGSPPYFARLPICASLSPLDGDVFGLSRAGCKA